MQEHPRILITRPLADANRLAEKLQTHGFHPVVLPTLEIHPFSNGTAIKHAFKKANKLIFISRNAVRQVAAEALSELRRFRGDIFAIGSGTAAELYAVNIRDVIYPLDTFNSESLLALPELQEVLEQNIVIFAGLGGRDFLAQSLTAQGANVEKIATYERHPAQHEPDRIDQALQNLTAIVSTSNETLHQFTQLLHRTHHLQILQTPLFVISKGMVELAHKSGFSKIMAAPNASDDAIVETLRHWMGKR
jgi:uroporphyrinogen-III synthase